MNIYSISFCNGIRKLLASCILLAGLSVNAFSQKVEREIEQQFDVYRKQQLQEKMYVHTDKEFYLAGEICWFRIFAVDAFFHQPIGLSKVAYAELLDDTNHPLIQAKIALEKGGGNGSLFVPVTINSGNYTLRVYTNWMKNFSAAYYFEKKISVVNTQLVTALPVYSTQPVYDIQFFPEGGNMVNGLAGKVAYRVVDQNGKGMDCNAILVSNKEDTLVKFRPTKFGMGSFDLTPVAGQHYAATFFMPGGLRVSKDLPVAYNSGYTMHLFDVNEQQIKITVQAIADEREPVPLKVYLLAHTRGSVKASMGAAFQNGIASFSINRNDLGEGISQLTVFTNERKAVCERLFFKQPQQLNVNIVSDQQVYNPRQKINLQVGATDPQLKPLQADMSMAVFKVDSLQQPTNCGISEYLWLCSDLPGSIESPEYYFSQAAGVPEAIDILMLTNGWRRFKWDDVVQQKKPVFNFVPEHNGHMITGKIVNNTTGVNAENITAYFSVPGTTNYRTSVSGKGGRVKFEMQRFYGTPGIVVQTDGQVDSIYHIEIDNPFSTGYSGKRLPEFIMPLYPATLLSRSISMQAENMYDGDNRKKVKDGWIDTTKFYQHANEIYLLDNYVRFTTMEEVLREYVTSVNVRRRNGKFYLPVFNDDPSSGYFNLDPLVLLDGVPVFNMDKFMQYDPLKVRRLETVTRRYIYGQTISDGIINLETYNGNLEGFELDPHATVIDYEALQLQREFYSPVYEIAQQSNLHLPDFRTVLNWCPTMKPGTDGKYPNTFYSSDIPGKYVVEVQALSAGGKTGSGKYFFEVKVPIK